MKSGLKRLYYILTGKYNHITKGVICKKEWYGNEYGGFFIAPQLLNENSIVYSFGIGEDISFDRAIIDKKNCKVFGFDPTPKSIDWCKNQILPDRFYLNEFGISITSGDVRFNLPNNNKHVSGSMIHHKHVSENFLKVKMRSFDDIVNLLNHKKIDLLKMDIEGSEYEVIDSILKSDIIIDQIVIEFHERFFNNGKEKTIHAINKFKNKGYQIFGISKSYQEISFVKMSAISR